MPTCRDIIRRALQQARIVALGRDPTAKESEAGMLALQGIYDGWVTSGMFGRLTDVYKSEDYTAQPGERIFADDATITLPDTVDDTDNGGTRVPYDLAAISVNDGGWRHWVWTGVWTELTGLTLDDTAPLSDRDSEGLSALLASYLAEGFGTEIGQMTSRRAAQFQGSISHKFGSTQPATTAEYF